MTVECKNCGNYNHSTIFYKQFTKYMICQSCLQKIYINSQKNIDEHKTNP